MIDGLTTSSFSKSAVSSSRNCSSPSRAKILLIGILRAVAIISSVSNLGQPSCDARSRPTADLPVPMKPMRTIDRLAELTPLLYCRMSITSINPATGETLREFQELDAAAVEQKLATAARAFRTNRRSSFSERAAVLQEAAD